MHSKRIATVVTSALVAVGALTAVASGQDGRHQTASHSTSLVRATSPVATVLEDKAGDVSKPKLDIRQVKVVNTAAKLKVRVYFPGVSKTYDFPLGAVSVFVDTVAKHPGPEYGHFMDFFSDYRFAVTDHWRESPTPEWGHSPEGACVETAGVKSDKRSKLRWFEYVVTKTEGCFDADAVRVAVTTINTGDLKPTVLYERPFFDHLGAKRSWSEWIPVT